MSFRKLLSALALLAACAQPGPPLDADVYGKMSAAQLWQRQATTQGAGELSLVEAELARRGQTSSGTAYLGQRSLLAYGHKIYTRQGVSSSSARREGRDCSDFSSAAEAQRFFIASGGPTLDPYNLDGDGDGLSCEWGRFIKSVAGRHARPIHTVKPAYHAAVRSYSSGCYTGPRGGRYTITASGRKNYGGC